MIDTDRSFRCDREDCMSFQRTAQPSPYVPPGWIVVQENGRSYHFDTWHCLMHFASMIEDPEEIDA